MEAAGSPSPAELWLPTAVAQSWPGATVEAVVALKGDLSTRRFWRISIARARGVAPATAILVDLGPDDLPLYARALRLLPEPLQEPPWINIHRFLLSIGTPVPLLHSYDAPSRAMLVEDVGDDALFEAAKRKPAAAADLYRLAVEQLLNIHLEGSRRIDSRCVAMQINYDERLFAWELAQFRELGLEATAPGADLAPLEPEISILAARLGSYPRVFSHRDYHGHNLYLQSGTKLRVIDFQDALMAPAAQDLAVLLTTRDAADVITPRLERRLLDFYYSALVRQRAADIGADDFLESYRLCVLQHALKMIGRFTAFERAGKRGYAQYVPRALAQARRMLSELDGEFPRLRSALRA